MENIAQLLLFTRSDNLGSIIIRGLIWLVLILILAYGVDNNNSYKRIKADAGMFFLFLFTLGILSYLLFGFAITF